PKADDPRPRRAVFAAYVVGHPSFARVHVNRVWAHLFGRGLLRTTDNDVLSDVINPPAHPALLDRLNRDYAAGGHDTRKLLRWLCASKAYQLRSGPANPEEAFEPTYRRMTVRVLSDTQRLRSMQVALRTDLTLTAAERRSLEAAWQPPVPSETCED